MDLVGLGHDHVVWSVGSAVVETEGGAMGLTADRFWELRYGRETNRQPHYFMNAATTMARPDDSLTIR